MNTFFHGTGALLKTLFAILLAALAITIPVYYGLAAADRSGPAPANGTRTAHVCGESTGRCSVGPRPR